MLHATALLCMLPENTCHAALAGEEPTPSGGHHPRTQAQRLPAARLGWASPNAASRWPSALALIHRRCRQPPTTAASSTSAWRVWPWRWQRRPASSMMAWRRSRYLCSSARVAMISPPFLLCRHRASERGAGHRISIHARAIFSCPFVESGNRYAHAKSGEGRVTHAEGARKKIDHRGGETEEGGMRSHGEGKEASR